MMNEGKKRVGTGAVIAVAVYGILFLSGYPLVLHAAAALLSMTAAYEIMLASGLDRRAPLLWLCVLGAGCLSLFPIPGYTFLLCICVPLLFGFFLWLMRHLQHFRLTHQWQHILLAAGIVMLIKSLPLLGSMEHGLFYLLIAVTTSFLTDVFAYHTGKKFGKHKLAPILSPHKTIEGSVGGMLLTSIALLLLKPIFTLFSGATCSVSVYSLYVLVLSIAAQLGDLSMSAIKRIDGVKDFGTLLPGHGGILDRFDSHIFAIALFAVLLLIFSGFAVGC